MNIYKHLYKIIWNTEPHQGVILVEREDSDEFEFMYEFLRIAYCLRLNIT